MNEIHPYISTQYLACLAQLRPQSHASGGYLPIICHTNSISCYQDIVPARADSSPDVAPYLHIRPLLCVSVANLFFSIYFRSESTRGGLRLRVKLEGKNVEPLEPLASPLSPFTFPPPRWELRLGSEDLEFTNAVTVTYHCTVPSLFRRSAFGFTLFFVGFSV